MEAFSSCSKWQQARGIRAFPYVASKTFRLPFEELGNEFIDALHIRDMPYSTTTMHSFNKLKSIQSHTSQLAWCVCLNSECINFPRRPTASLLPPSVFTWRTCACAREGVRLPTYFLLPSFSSHAPCLLNGACSRRYFKARPWELIAELPCASFTLSLSRISPCFGFRPEFRYDMSYLTTSLHLFLREYRE